LKRGWGRIDLKKNGLTVCSRDQKKKKKTTCTHRAKQTAFGDTHADLLSGNVIKKGEKEGVRGGKKTIVSELEEEKGKTPGEATWNTPKKQTPPNPKKKERATKAVDLVRCISRITIDNWRGR